MVYKRLRWAIGLVLVALLLWSHAKSRLVLAHTQNVHFAAQTVLHAIHGQLNGDAPPQPLSLSTNQLEPGDIILFHNDHGGYGYWTHAVLYVGNGEVLDAHGFAEGTQTRSLYTCQSYAKAVVLRPNVEQDLRQAAARRALQWHNEPYDPFSALSDERSEYCSKLVWQAYHDAGVTLSSKAGWITPDTIAGSSTVRRVVAWP